MNADMKKFEYTCTHTAYTHIHTDTHIIQLYICNILKDKTKVIQATSLEMKDVL